MIDVPYVSISWQFLTFLSVTEKTGRGREAIGSLTNDDGDVNESWNVAKGLDWQNNFARASRFFVHFFPVAARLRRENV